jgi:hypothetical protein
MAVFYARSFPFDPKKELENFRCKQANYEAEWRYTGDPAAIREALLNAHAAGQLPSELNWLVTAVGGIIMKGRAELLKGRLRRFERYLCVERLRRCNGKDLISKKLALDRAAETLSPTARSTIEDDYNLVSRDLKKKGPKSEYTFLAARSKPMGVPVLITRGPNGEVIINGGMRSRNAAHQSGEGVKIGKNSPPGSVKICWNSPLV